MTDSITKRETLYPVFLKLERMELLLVGAGNKGLEKLKSFLDNSPSAKITVVAPHIEEEIKELLQKHPSCSLQQRSFREEDLDNKNIAVLATDNIALHQEIKLLAEDRGILVYAIDASGLSDFYPGTFFGKNDLHNTVVIGDSVSKNVRLSKKPGSLDLGNENILQSDIVRNEKKWKKIATYFLLAFAFMLIGHFIFSYIPFRQIADDTVSWYHKLDKNFHWILLAGFLAQLVDGSLGMGYGVTSATVLLSSGISPAAISGSIHTAEVFSSAASGYSHYKFGNVNKKLFKALVIPGIIGAAAGALLLTWLGNTSGVWLRVLLAAYTLFLGIKFLFNAFRKPKPQKKFKHYSALAGAGGFVDSFGGGGWGPLVTTTLINKGRNPKYVIGSVSLTEFFVTFTSAFTFFTILGVSHWQVILALILGGGIAAPIAAKLTGKIPRKTAFILLGVLVIIWSLRILLKVVS
jgi:uncharacterized protein